MTEPGFEPRQEALGSVPLTTVLYCPKNEGDPEDPDLEEGPGQWEGKESRNAIWT